MKLSIFERMVLANQYMIMLKLCGRDDYIDEKWVEDKLKAVTSGYEGHYEHDHIYDEPLAQEKCDLVIDTLNMYRAFYQAVKDHGKPKESRWVTFQGFDGNYEGEYMLYAEYYCQLDQGRFLEQDIKTFNSHSASADSYGRMIQEWKKIGEHKDLTKGELEQILAVA